LRGVASEGRRVFFVRGGGFEEEVFSWVMREVQGWGHFRSLTQRTKLYWNRGEKGFIPLGPRLLGGCFPVRR